MIRHSIKLAGLGTAYALAAALPAGAAADRPPLQPTRDVTVEYRIVDAPGQPPAGPHPDKIKVYFSANGKRLRVEPAGQTMYMVMDRDAKRMEVVMADQHGYMELPYDAKRVDSFSAAEGATFVRKGSDTVAGIGCTVWDVKSPQNTGTICMTDDGVMLRADGQDGQQRGGLLAVAVNYGAQPASLFAPPADFQKIEMPKGMGMPPGGRPPG